MRHTALFATVLLALLASCSGSDRDRGSSSFTSGASASATDGEGPGSDDGIDRFDVAATDGVADDGGGECAAVSETATNEKQPADIIMVVDNSGSMDFEAAFVQNYLNIFSNQISLSGIDVRVILLSSYPGNGNGVCVDPPLGGGGCPAQDNNVPTLTHVDQRIASNDGLVQVINRHADYADVMRPHAARHVVIVTDDDSDLGSGQFDAMFKSLAPFYDPYTFHAIASPEDPVVACLLQTDCCFYSAAQGGVYQDLVQMTGGIFGNLCQQNFQPVFDELSTAVVEGATLSCGWDIPDPPDGVDFNPDQVNVEFDDGMGNVEVFGRVDSIAECANVSDGWYYDDPVNPTQILACPQTCQKIQGVTNASINIQFGCATIPAG